MELDTKDIFSLFLYCKAQITQMQCKDKINEYREFIEYIRKELDLINITDLSKEESLVLDKIRVYLVFAEKDIIIKLENSKNYQWKNGGV